MAFGQQSGPPATARQLKDLETLVVAAGHSDFRDARGPLGLTQRQAAGKFTRDEADELIGRLEAEADGADGSAGATEPAPPAAARGAAPRSAATSAAAVERRIAAKDAQQQAMVRKLPDAVLAAELQRRGWVVLEP